MPTRNRFLVVAFCALRLSAAQPWSRDASHWTDEDARHVLADSPWAKQTHAAFHVEAAIDSSPPTGSDSGAASGMAGAGSTVRWSGQPGRPLGSLPTIPVTVRWDSALPVREALLRSDPAHAGTDLPSGEAVYRITIIGIWPGAKHASGETASLGRMHDELIQSARLLRHGKPPLTPADVQLDGTTGAIHLLFPKSDPITLDDKEVTFATQFGPMTVQAKFRLKEMVIQRKLEL